MRYRETGTGAFYPPPPEKNQENIFGQISCTIRTFCVNFSYIYFRAKRVVPQNLLSSYAYNKLLGPRTNMQ